jgi:hypothetical protein
MIFGKDSLIEHSPRNHFRVSWRCPQFLIDPIQFGSAHALTSAVARTDIGDGIS